MYGRNSHRRGGYGGRIGAGRMAYAPGFGPDAIPEWARGRSSSDLTIEEKRRLWAWIQDNDSEQLKALKNPVFRDLVENQGAEFFFTNAQLTAAGVSTIPRN